MKTTVRLAGRPAQGSTGAGRRDHTTLKDLIETGLRTVMRQRLGDSRFVLQDASVDGDGLREEFQGASWAQLRDTIYQTRA